MKNTVKFLTLLLICFTFTSCDDDILDVDFNTTVKATIVAHVDQNQTTINDYVVLSLDNSDTNQYLDKIKDVTITKLTYKIVSFSGNTLGNVDVDFYADNIILRTEGFNVSTALNQTFEVTDVAKLNTMANLLRTNKQTTVGITGDTTSAEGDMDFSIEVTAELAVTANPL